MACSGVPVNMGSFDFDVILSNLPFLITGMQTTLLLTALAMAGGIFLGTLLALARLSSLRVLSLLAASYINFFRSLPLILVIFWFYFLVPLFLGRPVGSFYSVLVAFTLFEAAYYAEIIRAGITSVRSGQAAAARALGMTYAQSMRYVVLPQAFRAMLPVLLTQGIILFQDTSLVYVVGLKDFLVSAELVANREQRLVELFSFVALVYLVMCFGASRGVRLLERRLKR
jgi:glutamate/aspartate transport system permease protein